MKTKNLIFILLVSIIKCYSQVGIGTSNPKATLDIEGKPTVTTEIDGVLPPRISRSELINKSIYGTEQTGALIYVTDLSGTTNAITANITEIRYYYFDGLVWQKLANKNVIGDIKQEFQTTDHNGWIKLNGRLKTSLTPSQQAQATAIGIGSNLPDATNSYLVQNGTTIGSVTSSNSRTISQNQLPNSTLSGTTNNDGAHRHSIRAENGVDDVYLSNPALAHPPGQYNQLTNNSAYSFLNDYTQNDGSQSHAFTTSSINGNVAQQNIDITPRSLSVSTFIYLGN
jgi:hypothetical protein